MGAAPTNYKPLERHSNRNPTLCSQQIAPVVGQSRIPGLLACPRSITPPVVTPLSDVSFQYSSYDPRVSIATSDREVDIGRGIVIEDDEEFEEPIVTSPSPPSSLSSSPEPQITSSTFLCSSSPTAHHLHPLTQTSLLSSSSSSLTSRCRSSSPYSFSIFKSKSVRETIAFRAQRGPRTRFRHAYEPVSSSSQCT